MNPKTVKGLIGIYLVLLLFAFNFVFNQPMILQDAIMEKHNISVTKFNMLYALQLLPVIFLLIPMGIVYDRIGAAMIIPTTILPLLGQVFMTIFTPIATKASFPMMIFGRAIQGIGVEILYIGVAALAEVWMGSFVGLVVILPEFGEVLNVLLSPVLYRKGGLSLPFLVGVAMCGVSTLASIFLYWTDKKCRPELKRQQAAAGMPSSTDAPILDPVLATPPSLEVKYNNRFAKCMCQLFSTIKKELKGLKELTRIVWVLIVLSGLQHSIYISFLANAGSLINARFGISNSKAGFYLFLPFTAAIVMSIVYGFILKKASPKKLAFSSSAIALLAYLIMMLLPNSTNSKTYVHVLLILALIMLGVSIAGMFSTVYALIGGTAYSFVSVIRAIGLTIYPLIAGTIVSNSSTEAKGYTFSCILFLSSQTVALILCSYLLFDNTKELNGSVPAKETPSNHRLRAEPSANQSPENPRQPAQEGPETQIRMYGPATGGMFTLQA